MFDKLRKYLTKSTNNNEITSPLSMDGNMPMGFYQQMPLAYTFYKGTTYDNTYPSIKAIANKFMTIQPYAIDGNGKPLDKTPNVVNCLYRPNQQMSAADFREALAVMTLVHPKVYLLLWHKEDGYAVAGGPITEDNLAGFTFMEGVSEVKTDTDKYYMWKGHTYQTSDVIEIFSGYDPYNLGRGYAPSTAIQKWANVDDYIAAYQAGVFENGAVPSGQFIITAKDGKEFKEIVRGMQGAHRGSGRNNNVIYSHRPTDPTTGAALSAQIEWVPFAQTNKELTLDSVFKQANDKIDSAFGVPASIRGVNDNNTYASVRVDEQIFVKYTVEPFATKIYSRLNHELNRVTGGMGYALTFDLDVPGVAEEEKVDAERKLTEFNLINSAVMAGYSLDSVVDAFELSNGYKTLKNGYQPPVIENDKPEVDEGGEVDAAPKQKAKKHTCQHHHSKSAVSDEGQKFIDEVSGIIKDFMGEQIEAAIVNNGLTKDVEITDEDEAEKEKRDEEMAIAVLAAVIAYMMQTGNMSYGEGTQLLAKHNVDLSATSNFQINEATKSSYQAYLMNVAKSFNAETANQIKRILAQGSELEWNKEQIATELRKIMNTDEWRVQRLARTEEHRSRNQSSVDAMKQLMTETGAKIYKVWRTVSAEPCEFCQAMDGKRELVTGSFLPKGGSITGADGGTFVNTFVDVDSADLHPNCGCRLYYEVGQ